MPNLQPRTARAPQVERGRMDLLAKLNERHKAARPGELELEARIAEIANALYDGFTGQPERTWTRATYAPGG